MEIIKKMAKAKAEIKQSKLKKEGRNEFSKYDYFTPAQIEFLVNQVCDDNKLLTTFDLIRNELGVYGLLTVYDCESDEKLEYHMATAIPEIKATNIAQQLGGCVTYTERYLKMSAFGITDNKLDFDTTENTKTVAATPPKSDANISGLTKSFITDAALDKLIERAKSGEEGIYEKMMATCNLTNSQLRKYETSINSK